MKKIKTERLSGSAIVRAQAKAAGEFRGRVPVHRVEGEPPEYLRLAAKVEGGFIVAVANVGGAIEVPNITRHYPQELTGSPEQFPKVETEWELMGQVPDLLGEMVVGGLYIGKTIRLPINGVWMNFKISVQPLKP